MVSPQQKQYLDAMGVPLWQLRHQLPEESTIPEIQSEVVQPESTPVEAVVDVVDDALQVVEAPVMPAMDLSSHGWEALQQCVQNCSACPLHESRTQAVFGSGDQNASWMFVGEAPGDEEDQHGQPFVGRSGQLLTSMLRALKISREQVYITNALKCRPPENREPHVGEVRQCSAYLRRQIELVQPKVVVALGHVAAQTLLENKSPVGELRGQVFNYGDQKTPLIVTYHPAYLLRKPIEKRHVWQDLCLAKQVIKS